jgi:hypothetical protein
VNLGAPVGYAVPAPLMTVYFIRLILDKYE